MTSKVQVEWDKRKKERKEHIKVDDINTEAVLCRREVRGKNYANIEVKPHWWELVYRDIEIERERYSWKREERDT